MIRVRLVGGLGNQMFQYAASRAVAKHLRTGLIVDTSAFDRYKVHALRLNQLRCRAQFDRTPTVLSRLVDYPGCIRLLSKLPVFSRVYLETGLRYDPQVFDCVDGDLLVGYFQSERYFSPIRQQLLEEFVPQYPLGKEAETMLKQINSAASIAIHVRRGDYLQKANSVHGLCQQDYFVRALEHMHTELNLSDNVNIFVFSDDIAWCRENLKLGVPLVFLSSHQERPEIDMYLMSCCQHQIISNSTFSWWGAWLNSNPEKIVVAPRNWFDSPNLDSKDIIPDSWVKK